MELRLQSREGDVIALTCIGEIRQDDVWIVNPFERLMGPTVYSQKVLVSLLRATYIDSSGIGWLLVSNHEFARAGGKLVLHNIPGMIMQFLLFLKMDTKLTLADDIEAARALLASPSTADKARRADAR